MKPKFIVIEGVDGSGKTTQTNLLIKKLKKVKTIHFPQHGHEVFGNLVDVYLNNQFGPAPKLDYRLASVLYALDRFEAKNKINNWLNQNYWIVLDRYTESNFGHQGGKVKNKKKRVEVIQWLHDLDYKVLKNPKPDLVLFLDVPVKFVVELMKKMNKKLDGHESDLKHLKDTRLAYLDACKKFRYWKSIPCVENNRLLTPEEINSKIWDLIK